MIISGPLLGVKVPLQFTLRPLAVEPVIVMEECWAWPERDDETLSGLRFLDLVRGKEALPFQLLEVRAEAIDDFRAVPDDGEAAEPFDADIVIAFGECELCCATAIEAVCEVEE